MRTIIITVASVLVIVGGAIGVSALQHHQDEQEDLNVSNKEGEVQEQEQVNNDVQGSSQESELEKLPEWNDLRTYVDVDNFVVKVVEDHDNKRIIVMEDENGQAQFKSIFVKRQNHVKIIDLNGGLIYSGKISSEKVTDDATESDAQSQSTTADNSDVSTLPEYKNLTKNVDIAGLKITVVEDNANKRVMVLKDENGHEQYKSIFVKKQNIQKIIDYKGGLIFNGSL